MPATWVIRSDFVGNERKGGCHGILPSSHNCLGAVGSANSVSSCKRVPDAGHIRVNSNDIWVSEAPRFDFSNG